MIIKPASRLGNVTEYYFSRKLKEIRKMQDEGKKVINLGIGSPDMAPAKEVIEELVVQSQQEHNHAYQSYNGIPELRKGFAEWYRNWFRVNLDPNHEILPLIGSKEGIMHISMTFLEAGDEVLIPNPGYPAYAAVAQFTGADIRYFNLLPEKNWQPDLEALEKEDLSRVKLMWVNYPNMPTGAWADLSFFEKLVAFGKKHQILICNDNPYAFILNDNPLSILAVDGAMDVALELNSLSKAHNMAGWRVGMIAGHASYLEEILRFKSNMDSGMFKPLQMAAAKALAQPLTWYQTLNQEYNRRRTEVFNILEILGCKYDRSQTGMFVWADIPEKYPDGYALSDLILEKAHVFITPGGIFGSQGNPYIRVSLCSKMPMLEEAKNRIKQIF